MPLVSSVAEGDSSLDVYSGFVSKWKVVDRSEHEIHGAELERTCAQYVAERIRDSCEGSDDLQAAAREHAEESPDRC
eukprot:CAMPEP_0197686228 /NCGR_PEP_ID=MMETSP1338-20131121/102176_1 /TAXON_ID=43686 ORGANISM="Pelagodinium beii, Strain RCC1491" /NCGR_SAMPLE_ID=MMETSP1338 /ASSEMBLY_ACC=CAM_ASM_000754 /LENGTH=76 /DNA_ID=CAMNT_0043268139 /DNA_START=39 /DNA_END=266 /DNA_ORIENTATION=-